jgi:hypothetical protein
MSTKKKAATLWKTLRDAEAEDDVDEILAMSDAELDAYIASNGGDPAKIHAAGEALAKELDANRDRLAWHAGAEKKLEAFRAKATAKRTAPREKLPRAELLARIDRARKDPRFGAPVAVLFRDKTPEAATDEELEALLDGIELLADIEEED